jgi:hypothetical protein
MNIEPAHPEGTRTRPPASPIVGALLILVGLTWLAGNLGFDEVYQVLRQLWPGILILLGIAVLFQRRPDKVVLGLGLILAGAWVWAGQLHLLRVPFGAVFGPTIVVLIGGSIIWRAFHRPGLEAPPSDTYVRAIALLSGTELRPVVPFEGAEVTAVMGGIKLDLSMAPMARESATIDVFMLMGGAEIYVPPDWDVTLQVFSLMGGCVDKRRPRVEPRTRHLLVRGFAMMGGVEVKD